MSGVGVSAGTSAAGALQGKVCVVTGASRGIGHAVAEALGGLGASLSLCALRQAPQVPSTAPQHSARCDVSDEAQVTRFFNDSAARLGPPDVLVINAGVLARAPLEELTAAQWDLQLGVNLRGAFLCARAVWPSMRARRQGRIIAIGSISGTLGSASASAYNASKWGLTGFIKSIAEEGRAHGLLCAVVLPGGVETEMLKEHLSHCIEGAIVSGDRDEQRTKAAELIELLERTR